MTGKAERPPIIGEIGGLEHVYENERGRLCLIRSPSQSGFSDAGHKECLFASIGDLRHDPES